MQLKLFTFTLLFLTILFGCTKAQPTLDFPPMEFRVDADRLDSLQSFPVFGLMGALPRGFAALHDTTVQTIRQKLETRPEGTVPPARATYGFTNPSLLPSFVLISTVSRDSDRSFSEFIKNYNTAYRQFYPEAETTLLSVNGIPCWQSRRTTKTALQFRWLFDPKAGAPVCQIDLSVPLASAADLGHSIESMIGSFKRIQ